MSGAPDLAPGNPNPFIAVVVVVIATLSIAALLMAGEIDRRALRAPGAAKLARADAVIDVKPGPAGITTGADRVWVAARNGEVVQAIPEGEKRIAAAQSVNLPGGSQPASVAVGRGFLWIVDRGHELVTRVGLVRDLPPNDAEGTDPVDIPLDGEPGDVVISPSWVWVTSEETDAVAKIDPESAEVVDVLSVCDGPRSIAYGRGSVWVACVEAGVVLRINDATGDVTGKPIPAGTRPNDVAVGELGIWVIDNREGVVRHIDPVSFEVDDTLQVGARPSGIVAARSSVWIANSRDGTVTRIDEASRTRVGTAINVGRGPAGITAGGGFIWTADFNGDTVTRIDP